MQDYSTVPALARLAVKMKAFLDWRCCSGDETDSNREQSITNLPWRAGPIRDFMQVIDQLNLLLRFPKNANPTQGRFPNLRYDPLSCDPPQPRTEDHYHSHPVSGLPLNFYDPDWLSSLTEIERAALDPAEAIDLALPDAIFE
ncbi:hypothetical protein H1R20_g601, partial [Candolleomyces eurysporus]